MKRFPTAQFSPCMSEKLTFLPPIYQGRPFNRNSVMPGSACDQTMRFVRRLMVEWPGMFLGSLAARRKNILRCVAFPVGKAAARFERDCKKEFVCLGAEWH